jgi:hypothetical protein
MNLPYMALRLGYPTAITADVAEKVNNETAPQGCTVTYEFPARGKLPAVRLLWYEVRRPPMELFQGQKPTSSGCLIIGSKGTMYSASDYGGDHRLLPLATFKGYEAPKPSLPRAQAGPPRDPKAPNKDRQSAHHAEWLRACKGGPAAMSNFVDYAAQLTEVVLLGNVAMRVGKRVVYDGEHGRAVDLPAADQYLRREYRKGWTL